MRVYLSICVPSYILCRLSAFEYVNVYIYFCVSVHVSVCVCTCVYMSVYICACTCIHAHVYVCTHIYVGEKLIRVSVRLFARKSAGI